MLRPKPPLLVPERRRRVRIVTLRNFGAAVIVFLLALIAINIRSELRGGNPRDYGRLVNSQLPREVPRKAVEVVQETQPRVDDDQTSADPMLVAPMVREQWLHGDTQAAPVPLAANTALLSAPRQGGARVAIVGGPEGVAVVQQTRKKPVLTGGFGR